MGRLDNKNAVVTGAGNGIGREVALALAAEGANVIVNDLGGGTDGTGSGKSAADEVVSIIQQRGGKAVACYESVADFEAAGRIIQMCVSTYGRIDILVNVAGILRDRMCWNMSFDEFDAVVKVHLYGTFGTCRHAIPFMKDQKYGRIINYVSDAWKGTVGHANYGAAKSGIYGFTRSIAKELGKFNITCNMISPVAATRMTLNDEVKAGVRKRLEAGLITQEKYQQFLDIPGPEFVPPMTVFLATDYAANINGAAFGCSGGRIGLNCDAVETRQIYKEYKKFGPWTLDELIPLVPNSLLVGYINPAPPEDKK